MAYEVNYTDPQKTPIIVEDGTLNTDTSLVLVGKNFSGYGEYIAEDLLRLLENFANPNKVDDTTGEAINEPENFTNPVVGQLWFNTNNDIFSVWTGTKWSNVNLSTVRQLEILDTVGETQIVTGLYDENELIGVISGQEFSIDPSDPYYADFDENIASGAFVRAGISLKEGLKFHGTATSAQYADLAEMYMGDKSYDKGTVMKLGGTAEVTNTTSPYCDKVFGIVSSDPAYLMNSALSGTPIALEGRVPCKVVGKVQKGDRLVASDIPGVAMVGDADKVTWMNQVGRALEDKETEEVGLIEVVVGAK